nr:hydrogenase nickel incorporation protein HypB [Prochlorothrix hollandica]
MCQVCGCSQGGEVVIHGDDRVPRGVPGTSTPAGITPSGLGDDALGNSFDGFGDRPSHPDQSSHPDPHDQSHPDHHRHSDPHDQSHPDHHGHSDPHDQSHPHHHGHSDPHDQSHPHHHGHSEHPDRPGHGPSHSHHHDQPREQTSGSGGDRSTTSHPSPTLTTLTVTPPSQGRVIDIQQGILGKNDRLAAQNRAYFQQHQVLALNLLSSPGSGKTTLLEKTLHRLQGELALGIIVGDLATDNDAQRLRQTAAPIVQITTGNLCHLEADMVWQAAQGLDVPNLDILIVENVGNLVCPAVYDLGETLRVVLLSVTEGEDKPLKYPNTFKSADVVILTKLDIAEAVGFDRPQALGYLHSVAPQAQIFEVSARTGLGMDQWYDYVRQAVPTSRSRP